MISTIQKVFQTLYQHTNNKASILWNHSYLWGGGSIFVYCQNFAGSNRRSYFMGNSGLLHYNVRKFITLLNIHWDENVWVKELQNPQTLIPCEQWWFRSTAYRKILALFYFRLQCQWGKLTQGKFFFILYTWTIYYLTILRQGQVCMCERAKIKKGKNNPVYTVLPLPMNPPSLWKGGMILCTFDNNLDPQNQ